MTTALRPSLHNGHEYVDLGLSVKWATCNIGASIPSDYGTYFAWGETCPKDTYTKENSKWTAASIDDLRQQGVIDSADSLTRGYDAAAALWGGSWRMPTRDEVKELLEQCAWTWTELDGKTGWQVVGPNGNAIFLPAAGYRSGDSLNNVGSYGYCWTASATAEGAIYLSFESTSPGLTEDYRHYSIPVRAVLLQND